MLTGSDDGNVRIWKAKASDKLGVITARERAALEYRDSLKERWKVDSQVNKVARLVPPFFFYFYSFLSVHHRFIVPVISQNQSTKLQNSNEQCWKPNASKRKGEENIRGREKTNRNRRGRNWLLWNRLEMVSLGEIFLFFWEGEKVFFCNLIKFFDAFYGALLGEALNRLEELFFLLFYLSFVEIIYYCKLNRRDQHINKDNLGLS